MYDSNISKDPFNLNSDSSNVEIFPWANHLSTEMHWDKIYHCLEMPVSLASCTFELDKPGFGLLVFRCDQQWKRVRWSREQSRVFVIRIVFVWFLSLSVLIEKRDKTDGYHEINTFRVRITTSASCNTFSYVSWITCKASGPRNFWLTGTCRLYFHSYI